MKRNQSVIFNVIEDLPKVESAILHTHTLSPKVTATTVMTEYLATLLEGLNDQDVRSGLVDTIVSVTMNDVTHPQAVKIVSAISDRHLRHIASHQGQIQFSNTWHLDHMAYCFMVFRNNLDRIDRGDVLERTQYSRLQYEGIF